MEQRLAGVLGDPIGHSKSPLIQNHWLKRYGVTGLYAPLRVAAEDFETFVRSAPRYGFVGFNVTIPHKERAFALADESTATARRAGSVNTIWYGPDDAVIGDSTDGFGFMENLRERAPGLAMRDATVAMLGAGGASRAVVAALLDAGVATLRLANRTRARAEALATATSDGERVEVWDWPAQDAFYAGADLIVNATSLGMAGASEHVWRLPDAVAGAVATDLIYNPLETPFLAAAKAAGAATVDGLGMLLHQARPGFARWFGVEPEVDPALRQLVLESTGYLP